MIKPECFGKWWEAVPGPPGDNCRGCVLKDDCLKEFATTALPAARERLGAAGDLAALAEHLEVVEQAVLVAMAYNPGEADGRPGGPRQTPVRRVEETKKPQKAKRKRKVKVKVKAKKKTRKKNRSWGEHTHAARWAKERERHPLIAQLTSGMKLEATYKGEPVTAIVKSNGYDFGELTFPTLGTLTRHITGVSRSAVKFWQLKAEG